MKYALIHPSRSRPDMAYKTIKKWLSSAKYRDSIEYYLSVDSDDPELSKYSYANELGIIFHVGENKTAIEAINSTARIAANNFYPPDVLIVVSDDFDCPFHWDEALNMALSDKEDYIVKTDDGAQPWISTLPVLHRKYYKRFNYIYPPCYKHLFADTEYTHVAHMLGRVVEVPIRFPHNHYTTGKMAKDSINQKNDNTWNQGEQMYLDRLVDNFGLKQEDIVNPINQVHHSHLQWLETKGVKFTVCQS